MKKKNQKKGQIWGLVVVFGLIALMIGMFMVIVSYVSSKEESKEQVECEEICKSNNEFYYKNDFEIFQNSVCYCKTIGGSIRTYIMGRTK